MAKIKADPSFIAVTLLALLLGGGMSYLLLFLAALAHELGHILAICLLGGHVQQVRLIPGGLDITYSLRRSSYGGDLLIAGAGPAANLLSALLLSVLEWPQIDYFIGLHLMLCFFNLLPLYPLDGGKMVYTIMTYFSPIGGSRLFHLWSATLSLLLFVLSFGACFYSLQSLWPVFVFGVILCSQKLSYICKEAI